MSYAFRILKTYHSLVQRVYYEPPTYTFPASPPDTSAFVGDFLEKSQKYFTNPLTFEKVLRHLRHVTDSTNLPSQAGWYELTWVPTLFVVKAGDFAITWEMTQAKPIDPLIPADFSTTPRAQSPIVPEQPEPQMRSIQIHDSLIPVGDLPLSDLPPLSFGQEEVDPDKEESKRRIREARLKVQLAKLKAQRMEQKYYERYGQTAEDSEDTSDFSSESEEELPFGRHSHS